MPSDEQPSAPMKPGEAKSGAMARQRTQETAAEVALRRLLHRKGYRYRIHRQPVPGLRRTADIVFSRQRVAVFVDGCFWHCCPEHGTWPKRNAEWWRSKLEANQRRDRDTNDRLAAAGWQVVRVWEHESAEEAAERVVRVLAGG